MVESISTGSFQFPRNGEQVEDTAGKLGAKEVRRTDEHRKVDADKAPAKPDRVDLSDAARKLADLALDTAGATPESGTIPKERLAEIAQRLQNGFYNNDAVREEIAQRILPDLGSNPTE